MADLGFGLGSGWDAVGADPSFYPTGHRREGTVGWRDFEMSLRDLPAEFPVLKPRRNPLT